MSFVLAPESVLAWGESFLPPPSPGEQATALLALPCTQT